MRCDEKINSNFFDASDFFGFFSPLFFFLLRLAFFFQVFGSFRLSKKTKRK